MELFKKEDTEKGDNSKGGEDRFHFPTIHGK